MAQTKFDICNRALVTVGATRIASFEDGSAEAIACAETYEPLAEHHLAAHRWRFAAEQALLARRDDIPADTRWTYAWQLPSGLLALHGVSRHGRPIAYDRLGDVIVANAAADAPLIATYTWRVPEARWAPSFREAFTVSLAAAFALILRENAKLADTLHAKAEGLFGLARTADSQQQTARRMPLGRLIAVRR